MAEAEPAETAKPPLKGDVKIQFTTILKGIGGLLLILLAAGMLVWRYWPKTPPPPCLVSGEVYSVDKDTVELYGVEISNEKKFREILSDGRILNQLPEGAVLVGGLRRFIEDSGVRGQKFAARCEEYTLTFTVNHGKFKVRVMVKSLEDAVPYYGILKKEGAVVFHVEASPKVPEVPEVAFKTGETYVGGTGNFVPLAKTKL